MCVSSEKGRWWCSFFFIYLFSIKPLTHYTQACSFMVMWQAHWSNIFNDAPFFIYIVSTFNICTLNHLNTWFQSEEYSTTWFCTHFKWVTINRTRKMCHIFTYFITRVLSFFLFLLPFLYSNSNLSWKKLWLHRFRKFLSILIRASY